MRAFVTEISKFLKLNTEKTDPDYNFSACKRMLKIPLYQREYKWEDEKIEAFITDISRRDKFLGNIILDETSDSYEVVDGQQRITTCFLLLVYLYNYYQGSPLEQESLLNILKPYGRFILQNDSIGTYLHESAGQIELRISAETDVYFQRDDFERAYATIGKKLSEIIVNAENAREFKQKLLNSKILILISVPDQTTAIEQIFLDINEKAQLLDIEDIFKGHCFEIYDAEFHQRLRETWVRLKKVAAGYKKFGAQSLSDYLYWFLLEHDSNKLPKKLNPDGRHYLEGKTMDETAVLLQEMITFGESVLAFSDNINLQSYRFIDICQNSAEYQNTNQHLSLKAMSSSILMQNKTLYQKLPFMYFIYVVSCDRSLNQELMHDQLKRIVTNLYIYASLFSLNPAKKKKELIDHTVRDALRMPSNRTGHIVRAAKELRIAAVREFDVKTATKYDELATIYSIMDNYVSNDNWISLIYSREAGYNLEHFLIPDNRSAKISWYHGEEQYYIVLDKEYAKANKKRVCNYLIINHDLNEMMESYDVFTKIAMIRDWHMARAITIPKHIDVFIAHIESIPEYQTLSELRENDANKDSITAAYLQFMDAYFSDEQQERLIRALEQQFLEAFQN